MLIVLLFLILMALKLAATGLVYAFGPAAGAVVILACFAVAKHIETTDARPE